MVQTLRPKLRPIECVVVPDPAHGRALVLRDTEGIAPNAIAVSGQLGPILARFDGRRTLVQIASEAAREMGGALDPALVEKLAAELDAAFLLENDRFRARKQEIVGAFRAAAVRPAAHAGGAYHGDARELTRYIERE